MADEVAVRVDTENEAYPVLAISRIDEAKPSYGFLVPAKLMTDLDAAYDSANAAEMAVMRYIADRYPQAAHVQEWVGDRTDG